MDVYLLYLTSAIKMFNNEEKTFKRISDDIKECLNISEDINIKKVACTKLSDNLDVYIVIAGKVPNIKLSKLSLVNQAVLNALQMDQDVIKVYKISSKVDSDYKLPIQNKSEKKEPEDSNEESSEIDYEKRAKNYSAVEPEYTFDRVILPDKVIEKIEEALNIFKYENKVFNEWGLRAIEPHPSSSLSFYGPSGTGKTMAAEAIASKLGKKILRVSYADIESKYHGEGPKMVKAIFYAAERDDAVLFIDEADSLLSKRLTNVTSGSDQAINSMRSQLLISLEKFEGIVIFATNLVVNYDQAFLTRLISVEFILPDEESRKKIWEVHIKPTEEKQLNIPLADDVDVDELAKKYEFCGREIKKAVISACLRAAMAEHSQVCQEDFITSCERIIQEEKSLSNAKDHTVAGNKNLTPEQEEALKSVIKNKISEEKNKNENINNETKE